MAVATRAMKSSISVGFSLEPAKAKRTNAVFSGASSASSSVNCD